MSTGHNDWTRRTVLASGAAAMAVAGAPAVLRGAEPLSADNPVRIGHIGTGTRGWSLVKYTGQVKHAKVVAVCDVYGPHMDRGVEAARNESVKRYTNYKELLADKDVEAVVIATPDHWHEQMVIDATQAGKAIYCEKGMTMSVAAAKRMRAAVKQTKTVFQLGHQGRQFAAADAAGEMIKAGEIGPVTLIHTGRYFNGSKERAPWRWYGNYSWYDRPDPNEVIQKLDWEQWLGPAEKIDFNERHFWHWRCYHAYGTGQAGDLLSHELDQVQCTLRWGIPDTCSCTGQVAYYKDDREAPDTYLANYRFEKHDCSLMYEGCMNSGRQQVPEYIGKEGRVVFNAIGQAASRFVVMPDSSAYSHLWRNAPEPKFHYDPSKGERRSSHMDDFLECVRTGAQPRCHMDEAFIEAVTFLMSFESYQRRREVRWDAKSEEIIDEPAMA